MRVVLRSLDGLQVTFVDPDLGDNDAPVEAYALPLPLAVGGFRYYDFHGSRRDEDANQEVVRVYIERADEPRQPRLRVLCVERQGGAGGAAEIGVVREIRGTRHVPPGT